MTVFIVFLEEPTAVSFSVENVLRAFPAFSDRISKIDMAENIIEISPTMCPYYVGITNKTKY